MKIPRSTSVPVVLLAYLAVMSVIGYKGLRNGQNTPAYYYGTILVTLAVIVALHFFIKKREQYSKEREDDMNR